MDAEEIFSFLQDAIKSLYENGNEKEYFTPVKGRERSIVFRIAHALANRIDKAQGYVDYKNRIYVDIEANRCKKKDKVVKKEQGSKKRIIPDLIVHKCWGTSYLAVEFKCEKRGEDWDIKKLRAITKDNGYSDATPSYKLGAFIRFKDKSVEYRLFKNGKEIKTGCGKLYGSEIFEWY